MRNYKNCGRSVKRFYGVTFRPGEVKPVPGWVVDNDMVLVDEPASAFTSTKKPSASGEGRKSKRSRRKQRDQKAKSLIPEPVAETEASRDADPDPIEVANEADTGAISETPSEADGASSDDEPRGE